MQLKKNFFGLGRPVIHAEDQHPKPGVVEKLTELRTNGHKIAIASNQRAIPKGLISVEDAESLMQDAAEKLGGLDAWRICPFDAHAKAKLNGKPNPYKRENECRKPRPGMLLDLMAELGYKPEDTTMVGDSWRDRRAAEAAGVRYIPAGEFFKRG